MSGHFSLRSVHCYGPCLIIVIIVTVGRAGIVVVCIYRFWHKRLVWLGGSIWPSEQLQILFPLLCRQTLLHELR